MAYSRFSNSIWYTFWSSDSNSETRYKLPTKKLKNSQVFNICDFPSFYVKYGDIIEKGLDGVCKEIREFYSVSHEINLAFSEENESFMTNPKSPTYEEMEELKCYIIEFVKDVDNYFLYRNFFIEEWYKPIIQKLLNFRK